MNENKTNNKIIKKRNMIYIGIILTAFIILFTAVGAIRQDAKIEQPTGNIIVKSSEVIEKKYFDIALTRIPIKAITYNPEQNINNYSLGANGDLDKMDFGIIPTSSPARKQIDLSNDRNEKVKVRVKAYGNIAEYISFEEDEFILGPQEKKTITIYFNGIDEESQSEGELNIIVIVPKEGYENIITIA